MKNTLALVALLICNQGFAQCPFAVTLQNKGGICLGSDTLIVSAPGITLSKIIWYNGTSAVDTTVIAASTAMGVTVAGGNGPGYSANQFFLPSGAYVDQAGNVYVADQFNNRIQKFPAGSTSSANGITVAGGNGFGKNGNQLGYPSAVFVDGTGNIYVADDSGYSIVKFPPNSTGATIGQVVAGGNGRGTALNQLFYPVSLYVDAGGNIYVGDLNNNRVLKFPPNATSATSGVTVAGGNGPGTALNQIAVPGGVWVDGSDNLYVCDEGNHRVLKFPPGSNSTTNGVIIAGGNGPGAAANQLANPAGIFVDGTGNLYVADAGNSRIQEFPPNSTSSTNGVTVAGGNGLGSAANQLDVPATVFVNGSGNIYVCDEDNNRIQKFSPVTTIDTLLIPSSPGTYTAVVTDSTGCTDTTNAITIYPNVTPAVSISVVANTLALCTTASLDTVHISATPANGGTAPIYQWQVNGVNAGTNSPAFTAALANNSVVACTLTSNAICATTPTAISNIDTITFSTAPVAMLKNIGGICLGSDTLLVSAQGSTLSKIVWYNGSSVDTTVKATFTGYPPMGVTVAGGNGMGGAANQLGEPQGIYVDAVGNLYVADYDNFRVQKFPKGSTSATNGITVAGGNGKGNAANQFALPWAVSLDASGNLYVVDEEGWRVQKFPPGSTSATNGVTVAGGNGEGPAANQLSVPSSVCFDGSGNMYIADAGNNRVQKFPPGSASSTNGTTVAGGNGQGAAANQLFDPNCAYSDASGNIYVADKLNNRIQKFPPNSTSSTNGITVAGGNGPGSAANQFLGPYIVTLDSGGSMYVLDQVNNRVQKFPPGSTSATNGITVAGGNGNGSAPNQFMTPQGLCIDAAGNIYVADLGNNRVQKFSPGTASTINTVLIPSSPGTYTAVVTNSAGCTDTTNAITIYPSVTPSISITINTPVHCTTAGLDTVHFIATPVNGGNAPFYQWQVNGTNAGINSPAFTALLASNSVVTCLLTSNAVCATTPNAVSKPDTVRFAAPLTATIKNKGGICLGSDTLAVSTPGSSPNAITWYNNNMFDTSATAIVGNSTIGVTVAGGNGQGPAANQFNLSYPGLCVDNNGNVYVADAYNYRIQKFPPGSTSATNGITVAGGNGLGSGANQFAPSSVYVDAVGNIYVADWANNRILEFPPGSTSASSGTIVAGGNGGGNAANQFNDPACVFVDGGANIYVVDALNQRVQKFAPGNTNGITVAGGNGNGAATNQLNGASCVFVDAQGNIYVVDAGGERVLKFPPNSTSATLGTVVASGTGTGNVANEFSTPSYAYVDSSGYIYVADDNNQRILKFPPNSTNATIGVTVAGGNGMGTAANQFNGPWGMYVLNGSIYVADGGNQRIQKFSAVTTIDTVLIPSAPGTYTASVSSSAGCTDTTNAITIYPLVTPAVSIAAVADSLPACATLAADTIQFTATQTNGGTAPIYQWQVNGTIAGTNTSAFTRVLHNNDTVECILTSNAVCAAKPTDTSNLYIAALNNTLTATLKNKGGICLGQDILLVSSAYSLSKITWFTGTAVDTVVNAVVVEDAIVPDGVTVAGGNGVGTAANQFSSPVGVFVDGSGNLYVSDEGNQRIQLFPPGSNTTTNGVTVAGGNGQGKSPIQFVDPFFICFDKNSNMYVADAGNNRIQKFPPGSTKATKGVTVAGGNGYGPAANQLAFPQSVYVDAVGNIYVADLANERIQKFPPGSDSTNNGITVAGGNGPGAAANQLANPSCVYTDAGGNIYVADYINNRIQKFPAGSTQGITVAGGNGAGSASNQFHGPGAFYFDGGGNMYVADEQNNRIQKFPPGSNSSTKGLTVAGGNGQGNLPNQLNNPTSVSVDASGNIYVADFINNRVQKFPQHIISTIDTVYIPASAGTYTALITDSAGCTDTTNAITVTPSTMPLVGIAADTTSVCAGDPIIFTASATNAGVSPEYQWLVNGSVVGTDSLTYSTATLANGDAVACVVSNMATCVLPDTSNSIIATIWPLPVVGHANNINISPGQSVTVTIPVTGDIAKYLWQPPTGLNSDTIASPVANPSQTTEYTLTVTSTNGCVSKGGITVTVSYPIMIPSVFTPNGDGHNDVFYVLGGYPGDKIKDFTVYNRWGQKAFQVQNVVPNDPGFGWDGTSNGQPQPLGAFVYIVTIASANGTEKVYKGTVVLVR